LPYLASFLSSLHIDRALKLSRPDVGSSNNIKDGFVINSTPIDVLFLSPPESAFYKTEPIMVFYAYRSSNSSNNS
jgi:hypothetical protein